MFSYRFPAAGGSHGTGGFAAEACLQSQSRWALIFLIASTQLQDFLSLPLWIKNVTVSLQKAWRDGFALMDHSGHVHAYLLNLKI